MTSSTRIGRDDRHQVLDARRSQRNQQRQRRLRTVCRGGQRIQAKNGNAGGYSDVLGAFFTCGQGSAKQGISKDMANH